VRKNYPITLPQDSVRKIEQFTQKMKELEIDSIRLTEERRLLSGIPKKEIVKQANDIPTRENALEVISLAKINNVPLAIVSVNWCKDLVENVLYHEGLTDIPIFCNSLEFNEDQLTTGQINGNIHSSFEKRQIFRELIEKSNYEGATIFIGDSSTDILALLEAEIGILFSPSARTRGFCEAFGISMTSVEMGPSQIGKKKDTLELFTANSWKDIAKFLNLWTID